MRFCARDRDKCLDVTGEVQMLFDTVIQSMDWGSGFLSTEEMHQVVRIGKMLGVKSEDLLDLDAQIKHQANEGQDEHKWTPDRANEITAKCLICGRRKLQLRHGKDVYAAEEWKRVQEQEAERRRFEEAQRLARERQEALERDLEARGLLP